MRACARATDAAVSHEAFSFSLQCASDRCHNAATSTPTRPDGGEDFCRPESHQSMNYTNGCNRPRLSGRLWRSATSLLLIVAFAGLTSRAADVGTGKVSG